MGIFPKERRSVKAGLTWDAKWNNVTAVPEGQSQDDEGREAKPSHTEFQRLSIASDGKTSLVQCWCALYLFLTLWGRNGQVLKISLYRQMPSPPASTIRHCPLACGLGSVGATVLGAFDFQDIFFLI